MNRRVALLALIAMLVAGSIRLLLYLFPDQAFWHFRELLDYPGWLVQGFISGIYYFVLQRDPSDYPTGIDQVFNYLWIFVIVFALSSLVNRVLSKHAS
ncbi:MAG: hypothetical protein KF881_02125 [Acidobacteria bacterium]|nr:hypothetical protein [Acidobacteriota bacterium]